MSVRYEYLSEQCPRCEGMEVRVSIEKRKDGTPYEQFACRTCGLAWTEDYVDGYK